MSVKTKQIIGLLIWILLSAGIVSLCYYWMNTGRIFLSIFVLVFWSIVTGRTKGFTKKPVVRDFSKYFKKKKEEGNE